MLYEQYYQYYQAPKRIEDLQKWRDDELKELERDIAPATVQVHYGRLMAVKPFDEFGYLIRKEEILEQYENLKLNFSYYAKVFEQAFSAVLAEDEQEYYRQFYARDNDDVQFHQLNLRIQDEIIELEKNTINEWIIPSFEFLYEGAI